MSYLTLTALPQPAVPAAVRTIEIEQRALSELCSALEQAPLAGAFGRAAGLIAGAKGRVVVTGMGKSGLVGRKIAATLASTGTPAFFIHPAEASHGDLGMITGDDIVFALSWSGETDELSDIIAYCQRFDVALIAATAQSTSTLANRADIVLALPQVEEACPNRLAPTSSTIVQAAIGDALAVALIETRGFSSDDFRTFHPKGRLGAQLLKVCDVMVSGNDVPTVGCDATILAAMIEMSLKRFGITGVVDDAGALIGAFTDGDLRRGLTTSSVEALVRDHMSHQPLTIGADRLASEALAIMNSRTVTQLFVHDDHGLAGIVHLHDVLRAGVV